MKSYLAREDVEGARELYGHAMKRRRSDAGRNRHRSARLPLAMGATLLALAAEGTALAQDCEGRTSTESRSVGLNHHEVLVADATSTSPVMPARFAGRGGWSRTG